MILVDLCGFHGFGRVLGREGFPACDTGVVALKKDVKPKACGIALFREDATQIDKSPPRSKEQGWI